MTLRTVIPFLFWTAVLFVVHPEGAGRGAVSAANDVAAMIARIEGPQVPNRQGFDGFSLVQIMDRLRVPGMSLAVIKDFEVHWSKAYGTADVSTGAPVAAGTLFQAASISKPVAAMGILRLAQEGTLSLDADVNSLLTSWKVPETEHTRRQPVTLRALLSHTAGFSDSLGFPGYDPGEPLPTLVQILEGERPANTRKVVMERPPFTAFQYSGGGITVAQLTVEDVTRRPFGELMKALVLDPLGMTNSTFEQPLPPERDRLAARGHSSSGSAREAKYHVYPELHAAGLWSTAEDLAKLTAELQQSLHGKSNRVLSPPSAREMITPVGTGDYAIGFGVRKLGEGWYFSHGGLNWGFQCELIAHRLKGYGLVIMTNADSGAALITEVRSRVAAAYDWDMLDRPVPR